MSRPLALRGYAFGTALLAPLAPLALRRRAAQGKEDGARLGERLGRASAARPDGPLVWLHGASVGETRVNLTLAAALGRARPDFHFLITTHTRTGAETAQRNLPPRAIHQFAPVDAAGPARSFLEHWRPDLALFAESELWPNVICAAAARGIPLALVNARMSARSVGRWARRAPKSAAWLLSRFAWIGAADRATAEGLAGLSGRPAALTGNIKLDAPPPPVAQAELEALTTQIGRRMVWCAASTHEGEEAVVLEAHRALRHGASDAVLILCPRHPERSDEVEADARAAGFAVARRSRGEPVGAGIAVYLADTLGEMGLWLRAAPVVLLGGSLVPGIGGHNPAEPVQAGAALLSGPHVANFSDVFSALEARGGAARVEDAPALSLKLAALLTDPQRRAAMAVLANQVLAESAGALARTVDAVLPLLPEPHR